MKTTFSDAIVVLSSGKAVADVQPQFDELRNCDANIVIMTGLAEMELWSCIQEQSIASQVKHTEIEWLFISLRTTGKGDNRSTHFGIDQVPLTSCSSQHCKFTCGDIPQQHDLLSVSI
ncbi:uncharacterized protein LOC131221421 [Magnolia sinica]|uniref:uncharacterized protein LOC131221421 n=1 Tax=Magnolia sinica TaxID=86752 RepID=UPI00265A26D7|nr:uncharacterized protein LOC131221421 [Magnolia sinica]